MKIPDTCDYCDSHPNWFVIIRPQLSTQYSVHATCAYHISLRDFVNNPATVEHLKKDHVIHIFESKEEAIAFSVLND